jgi:sulfate permease, SulP family
MPGADRRIIQSGSPTRHGTYRDIDRNPDAHAPDHVVVLRIESGLYFANADTVRDQVLKAATADGVRAVVLDAETIPFIDVTASKTLKELSDELHHRNIRLLIARDIGQVRDILRHVADKQTLHRVSPTVQAAVDAANGTPRTPARRRRATH